MYVVMMHERELDRETYQLVGTYETVTDAIRATDNRIRNKIAIEIDDEEGTPTWKNYWHHHGMKAFTLCGYDDIVQRYMIFDADYHQYFTF